MSHSELSTFYLNISDRLKEFLDLDPVIIIDEIDQYLHYDNC